MADEYIYNNNHWLLNYGGGEKVAGPIAAIASFQ